MYFYIHTYTYIHRGGSRICQGANHSERVEREPITGGLGQSRQRGPGAEPLVGVRAEAESFSSIFIQKGQKVSI